MSACNLSATPPELVYTIAQLVPDLDAFTRTSRRLRDIGLPIMFKHVAISQSRTLNELSTGRDEVVCLIRELTLTLDVDAFLWWSYFTEPSSRHSHSTSTSTSLAHLLSRTPNLLSLSLRLSTCRESSDALSPCSLYPHPLLPLPTLTLPLPNLESLHLDATLPTDRTLPAMLSRTPNLRNLSLRVAGGYNGDECETIVSSLTLVPHLEGLSLSPKFIVPACRRGEESDGLGWLEKIVRTSPGLRELDLRTYEYCELERRMVPSYVPAMNNTICEALITRLADLPLLRALYLPMDISCFTSNLITTPTFPTPTPVQARLHHPNLNANLTPSQTKAKSPLPSHTLSHASGNALDITYLTSLLHSLPSISHSALTTPVAGADEDEEDMTALNLVSALPTLTRFSWRPSTNRRATAQGGPIDVRYAIVESSHGTDFECGTPERGKDRVILRLQPSAHDDNEESDEHCSLHTFNDQNHMSPSTLIDTKGVVPSSSCTKVLDAMDTLLDALKPAWLLIAALVVAQGAYIVVGESVRAAYS